MPSDRDQAQQWLAEIITPACAGADCWPRAVQEIAAAILDTPGVEVEELRGLRFVPTGREIDCGSIYGSQPEQRLEGVRRLVIRLPAEPIGETE